MFHNDDGPYCQLENQIQTYPLNPINDVLHHKVGYHGPLLKLKPRR